MVKVFFSSLLPLFMLTSLVSANSMVGTLKVEKGTALLIREGDETQRVTRDKTITVSSKDTIQTLDSSSAILELGQEGNSDQFILGEKTTFVIENYIVGNKKPTRGFFNLLGGKIRSIVNSIKSSKDIRVKTGTATIGVKGTDFLTEVPSPGVTRVTTFEGRVAMQNILGDVVEEVMIDAGTSSMVVSGQPPFAAMSMSRESLRESAQIVARVNRGTSRNPAKTLSEGSLMRESDEAFRHEQFNALIEQAARVKGSILNIQVRFPEGS